MSFRDSLVRGTVKFGRMVINHSPEILMGAGTLLGILGWRESAKAGVKCAELKEEYEEKLEIEASIAAKVESGEIPADQYTEEDREEAEKAAKKEYIWGVVKAQAPSVLLMIGSFGCSWGGYFIERTWYKNMARAYRRKALEHLGLEKAVAAAYGQEALDKLKRGEDPNKPPQIDEEGNVVPKDLLDENGEKVEVLGYSFFFDELCRNGYEKDREHNRWWLWRLQCTLTDKLIKDGILFYNDLLDAMGLPRVQDGYEVGWVYIKDPILAARLGVSNFVDFRCWDRTINGAEARFKGNCDRGILICPNLDPVDIKKYSGWAKTGKVSVLDKNGRKIA